MAGTPNERPNEEGLPEAIAVTTQRTQVRRFMRLSVLLLVLFSGCGSALYLSNNDLGATQVSRGGAPNTNDAGEEAPDATGGTGPTVTPGQDPSDSTAPPPSSDGTGDDGEIAPPPGGDGTPPPEGDGDGVDLAISSEARDHVVVANLGEVNSAGFDVVVEPDVATFRVPRLSRGSEIRLDYGRCVEGTHIVKVDARREITEKSDLNNAGTFGPYRCPRPDLVIAELSGTAVRVRNAGTANAPPSVLSVEGAGTFAVGALAPGAEQSFALAPCVPGMPTATADAGNAVAESKESNNLRTVQTACADLIVSRVSSTGVDVQNVGDAGAPVTKVRVSGIGDLDVGVLPPGTTRTISFPACTPGSLTATADATGVVNESNERNNVKSDSGSCAQPPPPGPDIDSVDSVQAASLDGVTDPLRWRRRSA